MSKFSIVGRNSVCSYAGPNRSGDTGKAAKHLRKQSITVKVPVGWRRQRGEVRQRPLLTSAAHVTVTQTQELTDRKSR